MRIQKPADWPSFTSLSAVFYVLLLGGSAVYGIYYSLDWPLYSDGSVMHYIAWRILGGAAPYRDIFDFNLPAAYFFNMLCLTVFGSSDGAFRMFDLFFCALSAAGFLALGWRNSKLYAVAGALFFTVFHLSWGAQNMAERDFLMIPFLLASLLALRCYLENPDKPGAMVGFGLLVGYMFWIKPTAVFFILLCIGVIVCQPINLRQKIKALRSAAIGMAIPAILIHVWLYQTGALAAFYDIQLHFMLPIYSHFHQLQQRITPRFTLIVAYGCTLIIFLLYRRCDLVRTDKTLIMVGLGFGLLNFYGQGKGAWYHLYPLGASMVLFFVLAIPRLRGNAWERAIVHGIVLVLCINFSPWQALSQDHLEAYKQDFTPDVTAAIKRDVDVALQSVPLAIREHTSAAIHFLGYPSGQLWNAAFRYEWIASSRHIYSFPLYGTFHSQYMDAQADELLHDLSTRKPLVIVVSSESYPYRENLVYNAIDTHQPWQSFFAKNYRLTAEHESYRVYARRQ